MASSTSVVALLEQRIREAAIALMNRSDSTQECAGDWSGNEYPTYGQFFPKGDISE